MDIIAYMKETARRIVGELGFISLNQVYLYRI